MYGTYYLEKETAVSEGLTNRTLFLWQPDDEP